MYIYLYPYLRTHVHVLEGSLSHDHNIIHPLRPHIHIHVRSYHHPAQLLDGQRAVRAVRSRLRPGIDDPMRVGVVGSSAGALRPALSLCVL